MCMSALRDEESMDRATRVAQRDVEAYAAPRKLKGFFADKTGVCALCGTGLGKRYTHEERREHEKGYIHLQNHRVYMEAFHPAREAHVEVLRERHVWKLQHERMDIVKQLQDEFGATEWIDHGDATRLKAAMWDAMSNPMNRQRTMYVLEEHKHTVRTSLTERVAAANGCDENGAFAMTQVMLW